MRTITFKLRDELAVRLEKRARRLGVSKSELVRQSIERELRRKGVVAEEPSMYELTKDACGCVDSGFTDLATNPKHMEGFGR